MPSRHYRHAAAGGALAVPLVTAVAWAAGYEVTVGDFRALWPFDYLLVTALLGAGLVVGWRRGTRASAFGALILLAAVAARRVPAPEYAHASALVVPLAGVLFALVAGGAVEYALRNPRAVRESVTRRQVGLGASVGVGHAALVVWLHDWVGLSLYLGHGLASAAIPLGWFVGGAFVLGTAVGLALVRDRLVAPALVTAAALGWLVAWTLPYRASLRGGSSSLALVPLHLYEFLWPAVLAGALLAGAGEHALGNRLRGADGEG